MYAQNYVHKANYEREQIGIAAIIFKKSLHGADCSHKPIIIPAYNILKNNAHDPTSAFKNTQC
jgi:hypothetical protein